MLDVTRAVSSRSVFGVDMAAGEADAAAVVAATAEA